MHFPRPYSPRDRSTDEYRLPVLTQPVMYFARPARLRWLRGWNDCEHLAYRVFNDEPRSVRDIFLRAEVLTMHYGRGQLSKLTDAKGPEERMLGALLAACWKIGGAANV